MRTQSRNALIDVGTISSEASRNLDDELLKQSIQNHGKNHMVGHNTTKYDNVCREFGRKDRMTSLRTTHEGAERARWKTETRIYTFALFRG